jgi:hypothetical protein
LHAWNESFFKLCVFDCGRFLRADNYTTEKDRLDFARVLSATSSLEVIKRVERLLVDDTVVEVQVVEEWGYDMGDDACILLDDEAVEAPLSDNEEDRCDPEVSHHVDKLVEDLAEGVARKAEAALHHEGVGIQPVRAHSGATTGSSVAKETGSHRARSCPPKGSRHALSGQWSSGRLQDNTHGDAGVIFSTKKKAPRPVRAGKSRQKVEHDGSKKMKGGGPLCHALFSLKRIARLPSKDRREVLRILHKNTRREKGRGGGRQSREETSRASDVANSSSASVTNDWKHWVAMQGDESLAAADVAEVGKSIGVCVNVDQTNMFSVLSKAGKDKQPTQVGSMGVAGVSEKGV